MVKFCTKCGTKNNDSAKFCEKCGEEFKSVESSEPVKETISEPVKEPVKETISEPVKEPVKETISEPVKEPVKETISEPVKETTKRTTAKPKGDKKSSNNKIILFIIIAIVGIAVIAGIAVALMSFSSTDTTTQSTSVPFLQSKMVTKDFGGITMQVPENSNFTQSYLSPRTGSVGGFVTFDNNGSSKNDVYSVTFSMVKGVQHPSNFVYQKTEGDVEIYRTGENTYYIEKPMGDYTVSLIGGDTSLMLDMINSVEIKNPTLNI